MKITVENLYTQYNVNSYEKQIAYRKPEVFNHIKLRQNLQYLHDAFLTLFHALDFITRLLLVMIYKPFYLRLQSQ